MLSYTTKEKQIIQVKQILDLVNSAKFLPQYVQEILNTAVVFGEYEEIIIFWNNYLGTPN
jgi:hypothetical protein